MLKIVSIVGFGGLGKTTLAKAVYDHFPSRDYTKGFVPVGQNPDVSEVLKKIIYEFENNFNGANLNVGKLQEKIYKLLENKRYFIVIDDIWDSLVLNAIRPVFPDNKNGSRVMITTRIHEVASLRGDPARKYVSEIKPLSVEDSETLFFTRIFGSKEDCRLTSGKREISNCILKRCGGMPLGINSITSLLDPDEPDATWESVWKSLGDLPEGKSALDNMNQILDLSYIHLPGHWKTCLLYVCMYPEDTEIDKNDLCRQWVAEGMVSTNGRLDAEDVAEDYFNKLINMCLIQPGKIDYYSNEVLSCRVHDIILDLLRSKSADVNFVQVIHGLKQERGAHREIRRVSLSVHYDDEDTENMRSLETIRGPLEHVRSVLFYTSSLVPYFLVFKYVRVLRLEDCGFRDEHIDLTGITSLFLLRYLKIALMGSRLKLPDQIGQLQRLETIDLQRVLLQNYPSDIVSLPCLSHLVYHHQDFCIALPDGIERLTSLQTLVGVSLYKSSVDSLKGLGELPSLRKLEFRDDWWLDVAGDMRVNALHSSVRKLSGSLKILHLPGQGRMDVPGWWTTSLFPRVSNIRELNLERCKFQSCPEWIGELCNLYSLKIVVWEVGKSVSMVSRLPSLACLRLSTWHEEYEGGYERVEEIVVIPGHGTFQALKKLIFRCPCALVIFEERAMPKLEKLGMVFCLHMDSEFLPVGIEHLTAPTLKKISLDLPFSDSDDDQRSRDHTSRVRTMLYKAFKAHHPAADIVLLIDGDRGHPHLTGLVELIETNVDSGRMSINTDVPSTSLHLAVGSEGRTEDLESFQSGRRAEEA